MLSRDEVEDLARERGLAERASQLAELVRPAYRVELVRGPATPAATRIGGDPDMAPDEEWPRNGYGVAMTFVAQIATADLPSLDSSDWPTEPWDHGGALVRVFADLVENPLDGDEAIALARPSDGTLVPRSAPPVPDAIPRPAGENVWLSPEDRVRELPPASTSISPMLSAPGPIDLPFEFPEELDGPIDDWWGTLRGDPPPKDLRDLRPTPSQILGCPVPIQEDPRGLGRHLDQRAAMARGVPWEEARTLGDVDDWCLLLQVHTDDRFGLHIHDGGAYSFIVPRDELARGRYDRIACVIDSC